MMDLISRTAIAEEVGQLKSIIKECTNADYYKGYVCALSGVEGMIAQQPTIDAVPVEQAKAQAIEIIKSIEVLLGCTGVGVACKLLERMGSAEEKGQG